MKQNSMILILSVLLFIGCTENKSVIEKLELDEVSELVAKDSLYEEVILELELKRKFISDNIVLQSKFKDLSIGDYYEYKKTYQDTILLKGLLKDAREIYNSELDSLLIIYKPIIDSTMLNYKMQNKLNDPSIYFKVEFSSISKEYYSYGKDVKNVNVKFKITPLKGAIQGGSFTYKVIPKVTGNSVADGGGRFSSYTAKPSTYIWEANYDIKKEFKNSTTSGIKSKYNFEYTILSARKNNKTITRMSEYDIPLDYRLYIDIDSLLAYQYESIMSGQYDIKTTSVFEIISKKIDAKKKKTNAIAFEFESLNYNLEE